MKVNAFQRCLALLLCMAMLLPNFSSLAFRAKAAEEVPLATDVEDKWTPASDPFASGEIPVFTTSGSVSQTLENDCGNGLTGDGAKSYMRIITGSKASEAINYHLALTAAGFTRVANQTLSGKVGNNDFARFLSPKKDYVLTVYHIEGYGETHLIVDTAEDIAKDFAGGFMYQSTTGEVAQTMMTLYGLSMSPNGYDISTETAYGTGARNCGALIVIRMPDNSLFINDGGDIQQWSDEACADFMQFCRELTGKEEGEKVVINTWFVSHAHSDHFEGIPRFFDLYHDQIDIKNVMYNIDDECLTSTRDMSAVMAMVHGYFPDAKYYKPHTGDHFDIAGVEFDVLYTQEDRFLPDANGNLSCGNVASKDREGGTYRECLVDGTDDKKGNLYDFNDTSTVLKVTFPTELTKTDKDVTSILYADANHAEEVIMNMWPDSVLATDIMMVPHHGHDAHPELVAMSKASIFLYTQAKSAIYGPNGIPDEDVDLAGTYRTALVRDFLAMHNYDADKDGNADLYFETTAARKTYWEGTETACILFGEDTAFQNMPTGLERDSEDPAGFTVYIMDAPFFEYTGWQIIGTIKGSNFVTSGTVTTGTKRIRAVGVNLDDDTVENDILSSGSLYAIVHDKTDRLMTYNALVYNKSDGITNPAVAGSEGIGTRDQAYAGINRAFYYIDDNDVSDDKNIYLAHDLREAVFWELSFNNLQEEQLEYTTAYGDPLFGGENKEYYYRSRFMKGTSGNASFWTLSATDAANAFRVVQPMSDYVFRTTTASLNDKDKGINYNVRIEFFANDNTTEDLDKDGIVDSCDTCVIYYSNTAADDLRFLTVDESGNWVQKKYTSKDAAEKDLANLKLRLYRYEETDDDKMVNMSGYSDYSVIKRTAATDVVHYIANNLTVTDKSRADFEIPCSGTTAKPGYYYLDMSGYDGTNDCTVTVYYCNDEGDPTLIGTVSVSMVDSFNMYTDYNDDDTAYAGTQYGSRYGFMYVGTTTIYEEVKTHTNLMDMTVNKLTLDSNGETVVVSEIVRITPDMLTYANGEAVDFSNPGVYTGLNLNYAGEVVGTGFTLRVAENTGSLQYPAAGQEGHIEAGKQSLTKPEDFLSTGVANIQLSASGVPVDKGIDLIIVMDLSGSMRNGLDTNVDAENYADSRMVAMENSLKEIIEQLQTSGADVRIAMSDFGDLDHFAFEDSVIIESMRGEAYFDVNRNNSANEGFEFYNHLNWVIHGDDQNAGAFAVIDKKFNKGHSHYTGQVVPTVYTGSGVVNAGAFVDVDSLTDTVMSDIIAKMDENVTMSLGTNYDIGLEYAYQLGHSITKANEAAGEDRELVCIFMSDGAAIQYNYFSGNAASPSWSEYLNGIPEDITSTSDYYADSANWPVEIEQISQVLLELLTTKVNTRHGVDYSSLLTPGYRWDADLSAYYSAYKDKYGDDFDNQKYFIYSPDKAREGSQFFYTYMDDQGYDIHDWDFLCRIARANDLEALTGVPFTEEYYRENNVLQELVNLLTNPLTVDGKQFVIYKTDAAGNQVLDANGQPVIESFVSQLQNPDYRDLDNYADPGADILKVGVHRYYKLSALTVDDTKSFTEQLFAAMESIGEDFDWDLYALLAEVNREAIQDKLGLANPRDAVRDLITNMKTPVADFGDYQTISPYDYFYNAEGKSWWAEAMKGDKDKLYPVINKYAHQDNASWTNGYYGTVRNHFSTGTGLELDGQDYISGFEGLDMELYTISFSIADDLKLTADTAEQVLKNIAGGPNYFFAANSEAGLISALKSIINSMNIAGTSAYYIDTMGESFDLVTEQTVVNDDGTVLTLNAAPTIKVIEYELDANGNRTGAFTVRETITFEDLDGDGDVDAWSDQLYRTSVGENGAIIKEKTDIWNEDTGLICAKYFYYNANTDKPVTIAFGAQGSYSLPAETFFWVIGTIGKTEMVLDYQVYLTGSFDKVERWEGDYATNASATLLYTNYLGMPYSSDSPDSPVHTWGQGKVGYGYYLVNEEGKPITADEAVTDFDGALKLTDAIYSDLEWNHAISISGFAGFSAVPAGYELFAPDVTYNLKADSTGTGYWSVKSDPQMTTYVQYLSVATTEQNANSFTDGEYFDTVVWFAVKVAEGELSVNKTVEETDDHYTLTLDAFANGVTSQVSAVKPADIVLVLDQSASMYTPAGMDADRLYADKGHSDNIAIPESARIANFAAQAAQPGSEILENASHLGYYIAVHNTLDYLYIVQYVNGGWYYVPVNVTSTAVTVDTANATNDGSEALFDAGTTGNVDSKDNPIYYVLDTNDSDKDGLTNDYVPNPHLRDEFGTYSQSNHAILPDSMVTYYKTQYGALYESVHEFVATLGEQAEQDKVNHRVAIVGFSSPYNQYQGETLNHYDGTGLYIDGQFHVFANGIADKYASAFADISTAEGMSSIQASVEAITTNYLQTCPAIGLRIARSIFRGQEIALSDPGTADSTTTAEDLIEAADPQLTASDDRDQIIILFTDGTPTVSMYSEHADAYADTEILNENWTPNAGVRDAINEANAAKREGVKVYTIGTAAASGKYGNKGEAAAAGENMVDFLDLVSSNYPDSSSVYDVIAGSGVTTFNFTVDYGTKKADSYALSTADGDNLNIAFGTIMESITEPTVNLDSTDVLKEVLSDYFDLIGGSEAEIQVYTAPFNADGTLGTPVLFEDAKVVIGMTDETSDRYDLITVSGYDYTAEYYSKYPRMRDGELYYGSKLVVKVPVQVREGFWGGNNVPTNEDTTGIYDLTYSGSDVISEQMVAAFPVPHVNVDVKPAIQAKDQVVYYGEDGITGKDLIDSITIDGVAVDGDLKPAQDWMDDYATLTWADGSATDKTPISGTASSNNLFSLVLKPNDSTEATVGAAMPSEGYTESDTGSVKVLVPVLTFRDSMVHKGKETDSEYYNATNYLGDAQVKWVDMDNAVANGKTTADLSKDVTLGEQPAITLSYTPAGGLNADTAVDVTVCLDGVVANNAAWFDWQNCVNSLHDEDKIPLHEADADQADFWIHVSSIADDPNGMITDKYVTPVQGTNDQFLLTLEAYATGTTVTKPADIVLVLDHSASMYTPAGAPKVLDNTSFYEPGSGQMTRDQLIPEKAMHKGYYVAQSRSTKSWFVIKYIPMETAGKQWQCYLVPDTESIVNEQEGAWTEHTKTLYYSDQNSIDSALVFYKSQYAMLYESVLSFVQNLRNSQVAHNVAIVGFAGYEGAGTRLYVGGDETVFKPYSSALHNESTSQERRTELYQKAMKNVAVDSEYDELLSLIEAIETNYSFTSPASGLQLANEVLEANPVDSKARDRIVVLFTDGIPNRAFEQPDKDSNNTYTQEQIYDQVVRFASATKKTHGAKVFTISTATIGSGEHARDFLHYISSDYPDATGYTAPGNPIAGAPKFTLAANDSDGLSEAFDSITDQMTDTRVTLDDTTLLIEVLSKYFDFLNQGQQVNGTYPDVRIYTQKYLGTGNWGEKVLAEDIKLEVTSTADSAGRKNKVVISGFDYAEEYVSDGDNGSYTGSKLVVEVDIKTREGFWGGDDVITNDAATGIYTPDSDVPVDTFPVPDTDVPVNVQIKAEGVDRVVYFGGLNSYIGGNADTLDITDLMKITAGGVGVIVTPNGEFIPLEEWMDDYVTINWAENFTPPTVSNTEEGEYSFSVTLKDNAGHIYTDSNKGSVEILVPEFTFNDTTVPMGYTPDPDSENLTSGPIWVDMNTRIPGEASDPNTVPTLTLNYGVSGAITEETPVQVTIGSWTNPDATTVAITDILLALVKYHWVQCQDGKNHSSAENVASHAATADSIEFTIHVGSTIEDQVVIDFGLSVDIDVRKNDVFGSATLVGLFAEEPSELSGYKSLVTGTYGELELHDGKVRYTLTGANAMQMRTPDTFWYVVSYQIGGNTAYDCGKLDVIPATIIYYEDSFIDFSTVTTEKQNGTTIGTKTEEGGWTVVYDGQQTNATQSESRPGDLDPNSIYGYDPAYKTMAKYSLGSARKVNVFSRKDAETNVTTSKTGRATFTFSGTGFDVVSLTSNTTGSIIIRIYEVENGVASSAVYKTYVVDTYYGYVYDSQTGEWTVDPNNADNALYQIPVMKVSGLPYGTYQAVISASYNTFFDHDQYADNSYDFYLDAIRIYDPAKGNDTAEGAHQEDGEGWPSYQELRDLLISADDFNAIKDSDDEVTGIVFIDGRSEGGVSVSDYQTFGPNNELYLKPGQSVAFELNKNVDKANMAAIHLGIKNVGETVGVQIYAVDDDSDLVYDLTINSATDLYYDITDLNGYTVVIKNSTEGNSNAILSLTNIKTAFHAEPVQGPARSFFTLRRASIDTALDSVGEKDTLLGIDFVGATLSFKEEIYYNVVFDVINVNNVEIDEIGLITWTSEIDGDVTNAEFRTTELGGYGTHLKLRSQSIAAKNMSEELYFKVYLKLADGSYIYSDLKHYSAKTYAGNMLKSETVSDSMKTLCVALMNYGAAAQVAFGHNTDDLMNADLTAGQQALVADYSGDLLANVIKADSSKTTFLPATEGFAYKAPSVNFGGAFGINYNFTTSNTVEGDLKLYVWTQEQYNSVDQLTLENSSEVITMTASGANAYTGRVTGIAAKNMEDTVYVCGVYESNGVTYRTGVLAYSVAAYMESIAANGSGNSQAMAQACAVYGWAAKCHFNAA